MLTNDEKLALLAKETTDRRWPPPRPADAATLIILDREGPTPKVLMGRRHPNLKFMPNVFVFPGGRSDRNFGNARVGKAAHDRRGDSSFACAWSARDHGQRSRQREIHGSALLGS